MKNLNSAQYEAATSAHNKICVLAGAGTGKTKTVVSRITYLNENRISCNNILCLTFTRLAGKELKERAIKAIGKKEASHLFANTFHAFCVKVLKEYGFNLGYGKDFTIYDQDDSLGIVNAIIKDFEYKSVNPEKVMEALSADQPTQTFDSAITAIVKEYGYRLRQNNAFDFNGLITNTIDLFKKFPDVCNEYRMLYKYMFVDEFQDTSDDQWELIKLLNPENLFVVGDDFQCQPPGTLVSIPNGIVPIERLRDGDEVLSWDRHSQYVGKKGYKIEVGVRLYDGDLIKVTTDEGSTRTTPNHKFLVRWVNRDVSMFVTYLMFRHDRGYRVGWCQLFTKQGGSHISQRARLEKAEKLWILAVHKTKKDATVYESTISFQYGIPTCMFEPNGQLYDDSTLKRIFSNAKPDGGDACLKNHGLHSHLPFWPYPCQRDNTGRPTYFECYSCNILSEYMSIPLPGGRYNQNQWAVIKSIERAPYSGLVYSLNVGTHHNYVADGVVTLNCIYGWRRANIDIILSLANDPEWQVIKLEQNYRSTNQIIEVANRVISYNRQTQKTLYAQVDGDEPTLKDCDDDSKEARWMALTIGGLVENNKYKDIAVLTRTNKQLESIKPVFEQFGVPAEIVNNKDDILTKNYIRMIFSYLELAINPLDNIAFKRAVNYPEPRMTDLEMQHILMMATDAETSLYGYMSQLKRNDKLADFLGIISEPNQLTVPVYQVFTELVDRLNLREHYTNKGLMNRLEGIDLAISKMQKWCTAQDAVGEDNTASAFFKWLRIRDIQEKLSEPSNTVKLMTVHAAKGLEFDTVFVAGMNQGLFPSKKGDLEEERRLFYVALTRAKRHLYISRPAKIPDWNGYPKTTMPSQFIGEAMLN